MRFFTIIAVALSAIGFAAAEKCCADDSVGSLALLCDIPLTNSSALATVTQPHNRATSTLALYRTHPSSRSALIEW